MNIIIFEDYNIKNLNPFSINHSSFELKCGLFTNLERITNCFNNANGTESFALDLISSVEDITSEERIAEILNFQANEKAIFYRNKIKN